MTAANLFAGILFGAIGLGAFIYGKRQSVFKAMMLGIALMVFPYFISNTVILYVVGFLLTILFFIFRD